MSLDSATLWITVRRAAEGGRRCRDYAICTPQGEVLLLAKAFVWDRTVAVTTPGGELALLLRRRLAFPLTGRVDVCVAAGGAVLGEVHRSGRFRDARSGVSGRFRDARGLRGRAGESVLAGLADALLGNEGSQLSAPTAFVCTVGDRPAGTLAVAKLPWSQGSPGGPPPLLAAARRLLPERARRVLGRAIAPGGWRFQREAPLLAMEPLLIVGAALFLVELAQW